MVIQNNVPYRIKYIVERMKSQMIPNNIRRIRRAKDITIKELASKDGLAYGNLWHVEHGSDVKLSTLCKIAEALNCNVSDLVK